MLMQQSAIGPIEAEPVNNAAPATEIRTLNKHDWAMLALLVLAPATQNTFAADTGIPAPADIAYPGTLKLSVDACMPATSC